MRKMKIGLVLSGGGAKGAYEAGVFEALWELGLMEHIHVVSGTSIGALNAMLFAMGDREIWTDAWENISLSVFAQREENSRSIRSIKFVKNPDEPGIRDDLLHTITQNDLGLLSQSAVSDYIRGRIRTELFRDSGKTVYACAYNIDKGMPEYFKLNDYKDEEIIKILLASSAIPILFKPIEIEGGHYADGGAGNPLYAQRNMDNLPVLPLRHHDCDAIIAVCLSYRDRADLTGFGDVPLFEIYPSTPLEPVRGAGTMDFLSGTVRRRMVLGYRDALVALAPPVVGAIKGRPLRDLAKEYAERNDDPTKDIERRGFFRRLLGADEEEEDTSSKQEMKD